MTTHPTPPPAVEALPYSAEEIESLRRETFTGEYAGVYSQLRDRILATVDALAERCRGVEALLERASVRLRERRESDGVLANEIDAALGAKEI